MKLTKLTEKKKLMLISAACVIALAVILWPLLAISKYNYASADDWSYGVHTYQVIQNHGGLIAFIQAIIETVQESFWEARFANIALATLQPGIFGEHCYSIVAYLMIGSIIFSEMYLLAQCIGKENRGLILPISLPMIMIQLLYCPFPEESFYWYTGAVNYTGIYSLSLILVGLVLKLATRELKKADRILSLVIACILAILVGGDNLATSLSTFCLLVLLEIVFLAKNKDGFRRTWFVVLVNIASLCIVCFSTRTQTRLEWNFEGDTLYSPLMAIWESFVRTFLNIISWTNLKMLLLLLLVIPFAWKAVRKMHYTFRLPGLFTALSFGVYASQATATLYVNGTMGGGRQSAILWYFYVLWIVANEIYWCGWIAKRILKPEKSEKVDNLAQKYLLRYCGVVGVLLAAAVLFGNVQETSSYRAYRMWKNGWAQAYGEGWEERFKVLKDDSVKDVVFTPLYPVELIMYADLQPEDGYTWVNVVCADYYGKESITVINP